MSLTSVDALTSLDAFLDLLDGVDVASDYAPDGGAAQLIPHEDKCDRYVFDYAYTSSNKHASSGQHPDAEPNLQVKLAEGTGASEVQPLAVAHLRTTVEGGPNPGLQRDTPQPAVAKETHTTTEVYSNTGPRKKRKLWRQYGKKILRDKESDEQVMRWYLRCGVEGCTVKKVVERKVGQTNEEAKVTINGIHSHPVDSIGKISTAPGGRTNANGIEPKPIPPMNTKLAHSVSASKPAFVLADATKPDCPILFASPAFTQLTGYSLAECVGRNCRFLQGRHTNRVAVAQIRHACEHGEEIQMILLNYKKDGTPFWNLLHITPDRKSVV